MPVLKSSFAPPNASFEWIPVVAGLLALYVPSFYELANGIWQQDEYAHGPIIVLVIAWLIWDRREALLTAPAQTAPLAGIGLLLLGLTAYLLGRSQDITILDVGSLVPILAGTVLAMRGWPALRTLWFAIFLVVYLVPLPGIFVDAVTGPLKQLVSGVAEEILYTFGYPIARSGVLLTIGPYQLLVADACSGLNSMFSLTAIGFLYLYLMQYKSLPHNAIVVASLIPIAFCANILRVIFLVLVTYHFGDAAGQGFIHNFSGLILFVGALILLLAFDAILRKIFK